MKVVTIGDSFIKELLLSSVSLESEGISIFDELSFDSEGDRVTRNYLEAQRKSPETCVQKTYGPKQHSSRFKQLREHSKVSRK